MPRFRLGQKVLITGAIASKDRGRKGTVVGVRPSKHTRPGVTSLDKYVVRFDDEQQAEFFDIQLVAASEEGQKGS